MPTRWSTLLVDTIDPVLAGSPFQPGQTGEPDDESPGCTPGPGASVIWCGPYDEVVSAFPHLADSSVEPRDGWCFDLTIEIDGAGRLSGVELEHGDLVETFRALGRSEAATAADALIGRPAETAVPELATLLSRLFTMTPSAAD